MPVCRANRIENLTARNSALCVVRCTVKGLSMSWFHEKYRFAPFLPVLTAAHLSRWSRIRRQANRNRYAKDDNHGFMVEENFRDFFVIFFLFLESVLVWIEFEWDDWFVAKVSILLANKRFNIHNIFGLILKNCKFESEVFRILTCWFLQMINYDRINLD